MNSAEWTVSAIAAAVRSGTITPSEVLDEALRRIAGANDSINAVVVLAEERARTSAESCPTTGRLAGVPMLVKDLHAEVDGLPLARGSRLLAGTTYHRSSTMIERLEAEGAVVVGRTNSPEFGLNITTEPELWGACRNPADVSRSTGGSSGGSAAAVASGMVPAAHGSDSGGSLRIPSSWCGVVGFKPSRGVVPHGPHRTNPWEGLSHEHAITTTVEDSRLLLEVAADAEFSPPEVGRLRVGVIDRPATGEIDPECAAPVDEVASILSARGHTVVPIELAAVVGNLGRLVKPIIAAHLAAMILDHRGKMDGLDQLERSNRELVAQGSTMSATDLLEAKHRLEEARLELVSSWSDCDLLVLPVTARVAPALGRLSTDRSPEELFGEIFTIAPFTLMFNVTGEPAMALPWTRDAGGVPVGVQLAGRTGSDALVLSVSEQLVAAGRAM